MATCLKEVEQNKKLANGSYKFCYETLAQNEASKKARTSSKKGTSSYNVLSFL